MGNSPSCNKSGRVYRKGEKIDISTLRNLIEVFVSSDGGSIKDVAREVGVSESTAKKYIDLFEDIGIGGLVSYYNGERGVALGGPGAFTLDEHAIGLFMSFYFENPSASLSSYCHFLGQWGYQVSESTMCRVLKSYGMGRGNPNLQPLDKYTEDNNIRLFEYLAFINDVCPSRLVAFDECHFDGNNVWRRKVRTNPFTGLRPEVLVDGSFRVRWNCFS